LDLIAGRLQEEDGLPCPGWVGAAVGQAGQAW
jgi:hypothetical protein